MSRIEALKYVPPNALTFARPFIGAQGMMEAFDGHWGSAALWFAGAWATDTDGTFARGTNSVTKFGAKADPVADVALRAEMGAALLTQFTPTILMITALAESGSLGLNAKMGQGRNGNTPEVPVVAKAGTVGHAVGGVTMMYGLARGNDAMRLAGESVIACSSGARLAAYGNLYNKRRREREIDHRRADRLPQH